MDGFRTFYVKGSEVSAKRWTDRDPDEVTLVDGRTVTLRPGDWLVSGKGFAPVWEHDSFAGTFIEEPTDTVGGSPVS